MSWSLFKQNMLNYMQGTASVDGEAVNVSKEIKSYEDFAKKLTAEYNLCMLRGFQQPSLFGKVMIGKGNTELMETLIKVACIKALNKKEGQHNFIDDIGNAVVKGYWVGAEMTKIPPIQPATGAWLNIVTTFAPVTFTGTWPTIGNTPPLNDSSTFLDILIAGMRVHLTTISGSYFTISLFPGIPGFISAGVLPYFTYTILPSVTQPVQPPTPPPTRICGSQSLFYASTSLDLCNQTTSRTVYMDANTIEQANTIYLDSSCTTTLPVTRYFADSPNGDYYYWSGNNLQGPYTNNCESQ